MKELQADSWFENEEDREMQAPAEPAGQGKGDNLLTGISYLDGCS
jgi:hypothetical protein